MQIDRASLKYTVKERMRGHYGTLFGITLLPLIILAVILMIVQFVVAYEITGSRILSFNFVSVSGPSGQTNLFLSGRWWSVVLSDLVAMSASLGLLSWWRHPDSKQSIASRAVAGFSPRYFPGLILIFLITEVLLNIPMNLGDTGLWWSLAKLVWFVVYIVIQLGIAPVFFVYMDLCDAGQGGIASIGRAFQLSWQLMAGFKGAYFVLWLSLLGWLLLCALVFPLLWVVPYMQTIFVAYYEALRQVKPDLIPTVA
jgi:uncharacterized membrane protein